jgi:hypothetical protein
VLPADTIMLSIAENIVNQLSMVKTKAPRTAGSKSLYKSAPIR